MELAEWEAYWQAEPWGAYRDNIHTGLVCSILANVNRRKGSPELTYEDFMLVEKEQQKRIETDRALAWFRSMVKR